MIGLIFWTCVSGVGLFAIGHVLPGTKPYCRRMSRKMWRYTGAKAKQSWQANRKAKRDRQERRFNADPKARDRNRRRTERKQQPLRLTVGHRPKSGQSVVDKLDRTRVDRRVSRRGRRSAEAQPQSRSEPPWVTDRADARHAPHPQGGGASKCGHPTQDGTPCQRLVNAAGKCGIKSHDSERRPRQRWSRGRSTGGRGDAGGSTPQPRRRPSPARSGPLTPEEKEAARRFKETHDGPTRNTNNAGGNAVVGAQINVVNSGGERPTPRRLPTDPKKVRVENRREGRAKVGRQVDRHDGDLHIRQEG